MPKSVGVSGHVVRDRKATQSGEDLPPLIVRKRWPLVAGILLVASISLRLRPALSMWVRLPLIFSQSTPTAIPTEAHTPTATPSATPTWTKTPTPTITPSPTATLRPSSAYVLSHCLVDSVTGSTYIYGEVQNNTAGAVDSVQITANGRDATGRLIWTDYTYATVDVLLSGDRSPFWIIVSDGVPANTASVEFAVGWDDAGAHKQYELTVLSSDMWDAGWAWRWIGEARNDTGHDVEYTGAVISAYTGTGANRRLVGCDHTYTNPHTLQPGERCTFSGYMLQPCEVPQSQEVRVVADYWDW